MIKITIKISKDFTPKLMLQKLNVPTNLTKDYIIKYRTNKLCLKPIDTTKSKDVERHPINYRTALCKFFMVNSCTRGDTCAYSHDMSQFPCKAFHLKKNCTKKNCPFSHELNTGEFPMEEEEIKEIKHTFSSSLL